MNLPIYIYIYIYTYIYIYIYMSKFIHKGCKKYDCKAHNDVTIGPGKWDLF